SIDVPDLVDDGGPLRVRVDHVATVGNQAAVPDQPVAFVSGGRVVATVTTCAGEAELPAALAVRSLGVYRLGAGAAVDPLAALEQRISLIRPGQRPLLIFDAELADGALRALRELPGPSA